MPDPINDSLSFPPKIEKRVVCISGNFVLSAQISSCFNDENTYFAVLELPRSLHKYWRNEFVKLNNVLARVKAEKIIFADVPSKMMNLIKDHLGLREDRYIYINKKTEINTLASNFGIKFEGVIECPPDREKVTFALLEAKRRKLKLIIKSDADYRIVQSVEQEHLLASDSSDLHNPVILANYAFSVKADIRFFVSKSKYSSREIYDMIGESVHEDRGGELARQIFGEVKSDFELDIKNVEQYKLITFFTNDFTYGYLFPKIPSTHIYNKSLPSYLIASSVAEPYIQVNSALLVDTGFFKNSETDGICDLLAQKNVFVKELRENQFRNFDLDQSIQYYPYDLLFVCSHAGFPKGNRFKIKFLDKESCDHVITIDTLDSFDITNKGEGTNRIVNVKTFYEFVELDGNPWYKKEYKKGSSKTVVEDFMAIEREKWEVLEEKENEQMRFCNVIITQDPLGPYIPMIHGISDPSSAPFVFNNACVSNYTMSVNFIFAGANFYVGTVKKVGNEDAINVASSFFKQCIGENRPLAFALCEAQNEADMTGEDRVYTCIGCHFMKLNFSPDLDNRETVKERLRADYMRRQRRVGMGDLEDNVKNRHEEALEFTLKEYNAI